MTNLRRVITIAEAGVNHNGCIDMAIDLVKAASNAGADIVKFQTFKTEKLVTEKALKANYQLKNPLNKGEQNQKEMLKKLELSNEDHEILIKECKSLNIEFLSTAFEIKSLNLLEKLGIKRYKIPSGEITNLPFLRKVASFGKPIIMSTGMASIEEIEEAFLVLTECGMPKNKITILQCTSAYPTPPSEVNLRVLETLRNKFQVDTGISDHSVGIAIPIASVALGATLIEKHLTLDKNLPGPDHASSIEPNEFKTMVEGIRDIELALGNGIKKITLSESINRDLVRKSLVAKKFIKKGDLFTSENLDCKRPGNGLSPFKWDEIIGKTADRDYCEDQQII